MKNKFIRYDIARRMCCEENKVAQRMGSVRSAVPESGRFFSLSLPLLLPPTPGKASLGD
jgi:hypothetical protein